MFVLFAQVFVVYYGMFCDYLTGRQIILSLKIKRKVVLRYANI